MNFKPITWQEAAQIADNCRAKGGIVVSTNGCFDILHQGHVEYLAYARQLGDVLIVAINSDASVTAIKGPNRPINSETARAKVLAALRPVDGVCIFSEKTPVDFLRAVKPHIHVKGGDWDLSKIPEKAVIESWGGKVVAAPYLDGFSTTAIIEKSQKK